MKKRKTIVSVSGGAVFALVLLAGCMSAPPAGTPLVDVASQTSGTGSVLIEYVVSVGPGWVNIHLQNADGSPGDVIGYAPVKDGVNYDVTVPIDMSKAGTKLIAMLHKDLGKVGTYEFPGPDVPVTTPEGQVVMESFDLNPARNYGGSMY